MRIQAESLEHAEEIIEARKREIERRETARLAKATGKADWEQQVRIFQSLACEERLCALPWTCIYFFVLHFVFCVIAVACLPMIRGITRRSGARSGAR